MNKHTSLSLSKQFKKAGFEKETKLAYIEDLENRESKLFETFNPIICQDTERFRYYPAYDILNDLCVKYSKDIFGEAKVDENGETHDDYLLRDEVGIFHKKVSGLKYEFVSKTIFKMLQQNKPQEEIENYIVANSILFNK